MLEVPIYAKFMGGEIKELDLVTFATSAFLNLLQAYPVLIKGLLINTSRVVQIEHKQEIVMRELPEHFLSEAELDCYWKVVLYTCHYFKPSTVAIYLFERECLEQYLKRCQQNVVYYERL